MTIKMTITAETVDELREKLRAVASTFAEPNDTSDDDWIPWNGGPRSPARGQRVQVKFRDGSLWEPCPDADWRWEHHGTDSDVIAYRVIDK